MKLTRPKRAIIFALLGLVIWTAVVVGVLAEPLLLGPSARQGGLVGVQSHYNTLGKLPLYSIEQEVVGKTMRVRSIEPHFGVLFAAAVMGVAGLGCVRLAQWGARRRLTDRCDECGYDLQGIDSTQCPECGAAIPLSGDDAPPRRT